MVRMQPVNVDGRQAVGIEVDLPKTRLVIIAAPTGYLMCGALDVQLLDDKLGSRRVVAGRALGVRNLADLLERPLESVTAQARALGLKPGMTGREALRILLASDHRGHSPLGASRQDEPAEEPAWSAETPAPAGR